MNNMDMVINELATALQNGANTEAFLAALASVMAVAVVLGAIALVVSEIRIRKLSQSFGHGVGFTLGLLFLNPIFMLILAFGKKSQYVDPVVKNR